MPGELTERQAFLVLNALPGIGPIALNRLLDGFDGDPRAALAGAGRGGPKATHAMGPEVAAAIREWRGRFDPEKEEARMDRSAVAFLTRADPGYPRLLREIHDPPIGLYRKGSYAFEHPCIAVVGSRRATLYGQSVAKRLGAELAERGFCVVSGLARGIDTAAHEGALSAGGRTAAVLGTGIDIIYPPENLDLYRRIAATGAVLSEFPFGRPADRDSFPMRDRIMSGICEAVVVVESDIRGGAMTTAKFAGEQGRTLFAVPGRIDQATSAGSNQLIRDGATLLTGVGDILQEIRYFGGPTAGPSPGAPAPAQGDDPAGSGAGGAA
ncbi:MAG TPA: DNA-processing protein DprA [Opitutaceae bacterium]|nr:DNA-processing protein DprA [Opitutaceae bacterium]